MSIRDYPQIEDAYRDHTNSEMANRRAALIDRVTNQSPEAHMDEQERHHKAALALLREVELGPVVNVRRIA